MLILMSGQQYQDLLPEKIEFHTKLTIKGPDAVLTKAQRGLLGYAIYTT